MACIVRLHRGEKERYLEVVAGYIERYIEAISLINAISAVYESIHNGLRESLMEYVSYIVPKCNKAMLKKEEEFSLKSSVLNLKVIEKKHYSTFGEIDVDDVSTLENREQITVKKHLDTAYEEALESHKKFLVEFNHLVTLTELVIRHLNPKSDGKLSELNMSMMLSMLKEQFEMYADAFSESEAMKNNIEWLQSRFPNAEYVDVLGLCKVADRDEYVEEQDYSLNAGRYVGIELEEDNLTADEFKDLILEKHEVLMSLNEEALKLEALIDSNIREVF